MMKCDMCYDRTSVGKRPMCATVCPSQALAYVRPEEMRHRREKPVNTFYFGTQKITTKVYMMAPAGAGCRHPRRSGLHVGGRAMNWLRQADTSRFGKMNSPFTPPTNATLPAAS